MSDGDTRPGFFRRSSRPPAGGSPELPEPSIPPMPNGASMRALQSHVEELHQDLRSARNEFLVRAEAAREAVYVVHQKMDRTQSEMNQKVDRLQSAIEGLRTAQEHAFKLMRQDKARDRWAIVVVAMAILLVLLLRMYGLIGV